jgi:hypothetical protein
MQGLQPPTKLREIILLSIRKAEQRQARIYFAIAAITLLGSVIGLVFSLQYLLEALYASEFYSYATLVFSDPDMVSTLWQDVVISLAESLPVLLIIACLIAVGILLASMRVMAMTIRAAFTPSFRT